MLSTGFPQVVPYLKYLEINNLFQLHKYTGTDTPAHKREGWGK